MTVIEVFIARNQRKHSLPKHVRKRVFHFAGLSNIERGQSFSRSARQAELVIKFLHKKQPTIAADIAAIEVEFYFSPCRTLKERT